MNTKKEKRIYYEPSDMEEKDMYVHLSLADFLRCIKNYENDK